MAAFIAFACSSSGKKAAPAAAGGKDVVATVGASKITVDDFQEVLKRIPPFNRRRYANTKGKMELLDKLVEEELFYQEALRRKLDNDKEFTARLDQIRRGILASMVKKELYDQDIPVSEKEIKDYFDQNPKNFQTPETVKVKLILIRVKRDATDQEVAKAKAKADEAYKKLKSGGKWAAVVEQYSEDRGSVKKEGLLPKVRKGMRGDEFDNVAFAMSKPGEISPVFRDKRGFNIIQFDEKEEAKLKDFEEVKKTIERRLKQENLKKKMDDTMTKLRSQANVKINNNVLDAIQVEVGPEQGPQGLPQMGGPEGGPIPSMGGDEEEGEEGPPKPPTMVPPTPAQPPAAGGEEK